MNKNIFILGVLAVFSLAGCQNLQDQIGNKLAEGLINSSTGGEVKVKFDDLQNGKFNVETKDGTLSIDGKDAGGNFKMTDKTGKTVVEGSGDGKTLVLKDENGKEVLKTDENSFVVTDEKGVVSTFKGGEGATRPAEAQADMPSPAEATDFNYFSTEGMTSLTYTLPGTDMKANCGKVERLVDGAGWKAATEGFSVEADDSIVKNYENDTNVLSVICGVDEKVTTIGLQKTTKTE